MSDKRLEEAAKKLSDPALAEFLTAMVELHMANSGKIDDVVTENKAMKEALQKIMEGFPGGDPTGHRRYHEVIIENEELKKQFWTDVSAKLASAGIIGFFGILLTLLVSGVVVWAKAHIK